jgi:hypothetical protein
VGRLELIRRQVHDAAGDRRDRSAHPQVAPAIGRHCDYARPPEEPPWLTTIASSSAASLCAARKAAAGPAALPVATSSTAPGSSPDPPTRSWPAPASKP